MTERLYSNGGAGQFRLSIDENLDWTIELHLNDMRSSECRSTYTTDEGTFDSKEPFVVNTFRGKTSDGQIVRFTIDENTFFGVILGDNYHYVIRPAKDYTRNEEDKSFVVYHSWDIIPDENNFDFINDALEIPDEYVMFEPVSNSDNTRSSSCINYYLKIAFDADFEFHKARGGTSGSSDAPTKSYILSILNIAEGVYESEFSMKFLVTSQHVYTTSSQPYTATDAYILRDSFRDYWNANHAGVTRNIAHLFTGKNITAVIDGIVSPVEGNSYIGHINGNDANNEAYALSKNRPEMYQSTAHEIGHNLDATHPTAGGCACNTNMASVMCQGTKHPNLWFCSQSISEISSFLSYNRTLLVGICGSPLICSGTPQLFTASGWQAGYKWAKSSNLNLSSSSNTATVTAYYDGAGWVSVLNSNNVELARYIVWVGAPQPSIDGPSSVRVGVEETFYAASSSLSGTTSYSWRTTPTYGCSLYPYFYPLPGSKVWAWFDGSCPDYQIILGATNTCGTQETGRRIFVYGRSFSPSYIYPNPVDDIMYIDVDEISQLFAPITMRQAPTYDIRLYDGMGNLLRNSQTKGGTIQFNVSALPDGIYYLHIYDGVNVKPEMQQIVVEH